MSGAKNLKKGDILFREGDPSEAMYVIKTGRIAITKTKGLGDIILAELGPGDMLGEMAFFDNKPRSAGAKALADTIVIELPFKALNAQFKTFPEWLRAIVRTVNTHLRNANQKIKNLEVVTKEAETFFTPHLVTQLMAILTLVAGNYGEKEGDIVLVPPNRLRNYTIQVFQQPTNKMQKLMEILSGLGHMKVEELGEGRQKISIYKIETLKNFVDFYNDWIFKAEDKKISIEDKELKPIKALLHFAKKTPPDAKGNVLLNLTHMQNESMKELGWLFSVSDVDSLCKKGVITDKQAAEAGVTTTFKLSDLSDLSFNWELIHFLAKVQRG